MKRNIIKTAIALLLLGCFAAPVQAQNMGIVKKSARTAGAGISVSTTNGKTTVTYKGKEVWTGRTSGKVTANSKTINGKEYVAAFDGTKVIWENVPGAGSQVR